jgi:hypothetical protein
MGLNASRLLTITEWNWILYFARNFMRGFVVFERYGVYAEG